MANSFGNMLRTARVNGGLTLTTVAATVGVTRQTVASWEEGRTLPHPANIKALGKALGVPDSVFHDEYLDAVRETL